ncbi:MAG: hypothetical protein ACOX3C_00070 [Bacilli bacterium]|jgi:hypothetical protein
MLKDFFKKYKFNLDIWAIILITIILIPNFIWTVLPPQNDVLRVESITKVLDIITMIFQILMIATLSLLKHEKAAKIAFTPLIIITLVMVIIYFVSWITYYLGVFNLIILLGLTFCPCIAFILAAIDRKNVIALIFSALFTVGHLIFAIANFYCIVIPSGCVY